MSETKKKSGLLNVFSRGPVLINPADKKTAYQKDMPLYA